LLVSVRNLLEACWALSAGCDVLDLKEPAAGALGMVDPAIIASVAEFAGVADPSVPLSVALGEALDWPDHRALPELPPEVAYFKLGTAGLGGLFNWREQFASVIERFENEWRETASVRQAYGALENRLSVSHLALRKLAVSRRWIAVAYADYCRASAPSPEEVIAAARSCGCTGVLIDTFSKQDGRLTDRLDLERLTGLAELARRSGLMLALAGSLRIDDLAGLYRIQPDIVGIRSAACRGGVRNAEIDPVAIREFRTALMNLEIATAL
jgi:uncharacterized protein (UPF0264 family)